MILLIDNYDSFSYNLYQLIGTMNPDIRVIRNDACSIDEIRKMAPSHIILSPGPGYPKDAGICIDVVKELSGEIPILGVCLGHQSICEAFGATIDHASHLMHGKQSEARVDTSSALFAALSPIQKVGRYHSLSLVKETLPAELKITAESDDGEVMAVEHVSKPVYGLQFHPESILTEHGAEMLRAFLEL